MTPAALYALVEATWPPAEVRRIGPVTLRRGAGGGSRVSAATADGPLTAADVTAAETAMAAMGQPALWMIRHGNAALDALLDARGHAVMDPVVGYGAPVARIAAARPPPASTFQVWPPLAAQVEIWAQGGIGPERLAVMARVAGAKTSFLGRIGDRPAGAAFVACHNGAAMVHAMEVAQPYRRNGLAGHMLRACAVWAADQGAATLALVVTEANVGARALYASLGMEPVGQYHYRIKREPDHGRG